MVWHIFKKDWKLLWPLGIAVVVLQAIQETLVFKLGLFRSDFRPMQLENAASLLLLLAWIFAIALAVFQDPLPGIRQDWLARPIRRRDLLGAKFLFAGTFVLGPYFVAALFEGLGHGFAFGATLESAVRATVWMALAFVAPVVAATSLFKSLSQGIITAVVTFACMMLILLSANLGNSFMGHEGRFTSISAGGLGWMLGLLNLLILLCGAVAILFLQFGKRKTKVSSVVAIAVIVLSYLTRLVRGDRRSRSKRGCRPIRARRVKSRWRSTPQRNRLPREILMACAPPPQTAKSRWRFRWKLPASPRTRC